MTAAAAPTLTERLDTALNRLESSTTVLDEAREREYNAARRAAHAREALEDTIVDLYGEGAIQGKNKEERDASLRHLTSAERYELREADDALARARTDVQRAEARHQYARYECRALEAMILAGVGR